MLSESIREALSAMVDGEASDRQLRIILAQAHDPEVIDYWKRLVRIQSHLQPHLGDWADCDLTARIGEALCEESPSAATDPRHADSSSRSDPGGMLARDEKQRLGSDQVGPSWVWSVAVAASVMGLSIAFFEAVNPAAPDNPSIPKITQSLPQEDYDRRIETLLTQHVVDHVGSLPTPEPLARLTGYELPSEPEGRKHSNEPEFPDEASGDL